VFGSEIKAILASGLVRPVASRAALPEYLLFGYLAGEQTMFEGISTLPPGHMLVWDESGVQVRPYWTLQFRAQAGASEQELSDRFGQVFDEAVRLRLLSDVPLGVFLSGGLDSSAIAAVMNRHVGERLSTFSIGFPAGHYSELPYARMVAEHLGADHHEVVLTADDFINSLPRMVWHEDEPIWTIASVAMYHVSRLAAQHVKVVLSGEGSDELFAGYDRYWFGVMNQRFAGPYGHVPAPLRRGVRWLLSQRALPERARRSRTLSCAGRAHRKRCISTTGSASSRRNSSRRSARARPPPPHATPMSTPHIWSTSARPGPTTRWTRCCTWISRRIWSNC
jgi:asparagine synthase (glutamine-hydrolysing)